MNKERVNSVFSSKAFLIAFSLVVAVALWMYVEINENHMQPHTVHNVRVVRIHEDILNDRGLLVASISPEMISLTFECTRDVAQKLTRETLAVTVDLSRIASRGNHTLRYEVACTSDVNIDALEISRTVDQILLFIDIIETSPIPVEVIYTGGTAEGFIQDPLEYSPQTIMVSGPAEAVSQIGKARVSIMRENLVSTFTDDLHIVLLDKNGEEIDPSMRAQLALSDETIRVTVPIRVTKEITLTVDTSSSPGSAGATPANTNITITPQTITVAGNPEDIRDFNSINLGTVDLTRFDVSATYTYAIVIPNIFTKISGESEANVSIEISGLEIKHFVSSNIQAGIVPSGYEVEVITQSIDVRVRGKTEDMSNMSEANIRVVANLPTELSPGTQRLPARVILDGIDGDVGVIGTYFVTVYIVKE